MTPLHRYDIVDHRGTPQERVRTSIIGVDQARAKAYAMREAYLWSWFNHGAQRTSVVHDGEVAYTPRHA